MTLIELINEQLDPDELIDILGLTTEDLTEIMADVILTMSHKFDFLEMEEHADD